MSASTDFDIAVIGVSREFKGASGLEEYWQMMRTRQSFIRQVSAGEINIMAVPA